MLYFTQKVMNKNSHLMMKLNQYKGENENERVVKSNQIKKQKKTETQDIL